MSVSIITFADLGRKKSLQTANILPVIDGFSKKDELTQVICRTNTDFYFKNTVQAVPTIIHYLVRVVAKILNLTFSSRRQREELFDFCAQYRLQKTDVVFFHDGRFLSRTLRKAQKNGSITVDITRNGHAQSIVALGKEELRLLGFPLYEGIFTELARTSRHYNTFDYVIAISDFVKRSYIAEGYPAERIFVANTDIDIKRFTPPTQPRSKTEPFQVLYVAYTKLHKGLHYLLDAWESLKLKDAELILVGGYGEMPKELKQHYVARIAQNPSIQWVGKTSKPEEYYRKASVFALPSFFEGNPKVVMEAMACGLPVVTTESAQSIVEDNKTGFVVPIRDAKALADKIKYFYDRRDEAEAMGKEARCAMEHKKPFGEAVYEIYKEILMTDDL